MQHKSLKSTLYMVSDQPKAPATADTTAIIILRTIGPMFCLFMVLGFTIVSIKCKKIRIYTAALDGGLDTVKLTRVGLSQYLMPTSGKYRVRIFLMSFVSTPSTVSLTPD